MIAQRRFAALRRGVSLGICVALLACTNAPLKEATQLSAAGRGEEALMLLAKATQDAPGNTAVRNEYFRQRELQVARWLAQAEAARTGGRNDLALPLYERVQKHDAANPRAKDGIALVAMDRRHADIIAGVERLVQADRHRDAQLALRPVLLENPQHRDARRLQRVIEEKLVKPAVAIIDLKPTTHKPLTLELRDVTLRMLYDVVSRATGISFLFDKDIRADQRTTFMIRNAELDDVLRLASQLNGLEHKIISETSVVIFPNTPQKQREYQELVVKTLVWHGVNSGS